MTALLPPGSRQQQDLADYKELDLDALDKALSEGVDPIAKAKEEEEEAARVAAEEDDGIAADKDEADAKEEKEEKEEDEESAESDDDEGDDDEAGEDKKEDEESPLEAKLRTLERRLELESLERVKETEARKRAELIASRQAGRAGHLQQQLKKSAAKPAQSDKKTEDGEEEDTWTDQEEAAADQENRQGQPTADSEWVNEDRAELIKMAISDEGNEFAKLHAGNLEDMPEEFLPRLQTLIQEEAAPYAKEFMSSSMKTVRKLARSLMNSAYATARIEFADKMAETTKAQASARKAESASKSQRRKAKAAISKGGKGTKKVAPKPDSYDDMDLDQLEAEFESEHGDNYRTGSDKGKHGGL